MKPAPAAETSSRAAGETGLPLLRSWPAVYGLVLGSFALWVGLLVLLTWMFS
jgi:hypothetical protein